MQIEGLHVFGAHQDKIILLDLQWNANSYLFIQPGKGDRQVF